MKDIYSKTRDGYNSIKSDIFVSHSHYKLVSDMVGSIYDKKESRSIILDAGCGNGYLLSSIKKSLSKYGDNVEYYGFDISDQMVLGAKELNTTAHVDVQTLPFTSYEDVKFDIITCSEVLEHLYQPLESLLELRRILTDNGHLIVTVPNGDRISIDKVIKNKKKFQPADDVLLTYPELNYIFRKAGFRMIHVQSYGGLFPELNQYSKLRKRFIRLVSRIYSFHPLYNLRQKQFLFVLKKDDYLLGVDY
jgi:2-polyprenyl-3-methyl-5-hydroxy-6-metoxy-1,4-benzoquinol methylase